VSNDPFAPMWIAQINRKKPDPALDIMAMEYDTYYETRDESLIIAKPGAELALLEVQKLPWKFAARLDAMSPNQRHMVAFAASCHRVKIGDTVIEAKVTRDKQNGILIAPESWVDKIADHPRFGPMAILEAGQVACEFAMLTAEQRRSFSFPPG